MSIKLKCILSFISSLFCFVGIITYAYASSDSFNSTMRPSHVPEDYVVTPFGYFHPSCVHKLENDEVLARGLSIEKEGKEVRRVAECLFSNFSRQGEERQVTDAEAAAKIPDGWQISSSYYMDSDLGYLTTQWYVPSDPAVNQGQTLFFFPGVQQSPTVSILQPVLGWNQLGQPGWSLASWNCCENGTITHSEILKTHAGEANSGKIYYDGNLNGYYIQSFVRPLTSTEVMTQLVTRHYDQPVNWVFGGVMENYNVDSCASLPANGNMRFYTITVYDKNDNLITKDFENFIDKEHVCSYRVNVSGNMYPTIDFYFSNNQ